MLRRDLFLGLSGVLMMPAIVHAKNIMRVRSVVPTVSLTDAEQTIMRDYFAACRAWEAVLRDEYGGLRVGVLPNMERVAQADFRFKETSQDMSALLGNLTARTTAGATLQVPVPDWFTYISA
jgi:hypothetical protein